MSADDEVLLSIAKCVTDGSPVDWGRVGQMHPQLGSRLGRLRLLESISALHSSESTDSLTGKPTLRVVDQEPAAAAITSTRWGSLQIRGEIGSGGYGEVFRAHDPTLQRDVALKLLFSHPVDGDVDEECYLNEARTLARVRHPNVLVVHGADKHDGRIGLWTDLLEGTTLEQRLEDQGPFGPEEATLVGIDLCRALAAVHAAGLVHRDIKTSNVMRERGGRIVLMDFSSVVEHDPRRGFPRDATTGTPFYMAPEIFQGEQADFKTDIYALGVLLFRLVSGRFPVDASSLAELEAKHGSGESTALRDVRPDLPTAFVQGVERALAHEAEGRYATAGEMERALNSSLGVVPQPASPEPAARRRRSAPIFAALSVALLAALAWTLIPSKPLDVDVGLFRIGPQNAERLAQGSQVRLGDNLFIEIEGSRPLYTYILNEDEAGLAYLLFPLPDLELENPLPPGVRHRLPGERGGVQHYWGVSSAGGRDTILVIASGESLGEVERELERIPRATAAGEVELTPDMRLGIVRGIGRLSAGPFSWYLGQPDPVSRLSDLAERADSGSGVKIWKMQLNNPGE